jgi:hypothetical protein
MYTQGRLRQGVIFSSFKVLFMHTNQNDELEDSASADYASTDSLRQAYGRKVQDLLSQCDAATWIEDLWQMYTGYTRPA